MSKYAGIKPSDLVGISSPTKSSHDDLKFYEIRNVKNDWDLPGRTLATSEDKALKKLSSPGGRYGSNGDSVFRFPLGKHILAYGSKHASRLGISDLCDQFERDKSADLATKICIQVLIDWGIEFEDYDWDSLQDRGLFDCRSYWDPSWDGPPSDLELLELRDIIYRKISELPEEKHLHIARFILDQGDYYITEVSITPYTSNMRS